MARMRPCHPVPGIGWEIVPRARRAITDGRTACRRRRRDRSGGRTHRPIREWPGRETPPGASRRSAVSPGGATCHSRTCHSRTYHSRTGRRRDRRRRKPVGEIRHDGPSRVRSGQDPSGGREAGLRRLHARDGEQSGRRDPAGGLSRADGGAVPAGREHRVPRRPGPARGGAGPAGPGLPQVRGRRTHPSAGLRRQPADGARRIVAVEAAPGGAVFRARGAGALRARYGRRLPGPRGKLDTGWRRAVGDTGRRHAVGDAGRRHAVGRTAPRRTTCIRR